MSFMSSSSRTSTSSSCTVCAKKMPKSTSYKAMMSDVEEMFGDGYTICCEDSDGDQNDR